MAEIIRMPRMSDTMEEGVIVDWMKEVGDEVKSGDVLAEVETDKATMELESFQEGTLLYIGVEKGDAVPVEGLLAIVGKEGEDYKELLEKEKQEAEQEQEEEQEDTGKEEAPKEEKQEEPAQAKSTAAPAPPTSALGGDGDASQGQERIKASPLAKAMAREQGIDLSQVQGTGDDGRIVKRDIENYQPPKEQAPAAEGKGAAPQVVKLPEVVGEESYDELAVSQMRKTIARRLGESKFNAPHFYLTIELNMDKTIAARKAMNESAEVKVSFNDIIVKAAAGALRKHPAINSSWLGDKIRRNHHIHIGVAVAVDEGLLVPVVRFADNKTLSHIGAEVKQLAEKARNKKLQPEEMQGNTFSISNLGMMGIEEFTAIINPPDSCIMAVGNIREVPAVEDGELVVKHVMKVTMSCDHRVVDGATGAQFLQTFKQFVEDPVRLLV